jgi:hypothetical protein
LHRGLFRTPEFPDNPDHEHHDCGDPQQVEKATGNGQGDLQHQPDDQKKNGKSSDGVHAEKIGFAWRSGGIFPPALYWIRETPNGKQAHTIIRIRSDYMTTIGKDRNRPQVILNQEADRPIRLERMEADGLGALIARLMDTMFTVPGTKIRFGLDSIIDLFPGIGDAVGALISTVIIAQAAKVGVPRIVLARMAGNVLINSVIGAVPFLGAVLSVFYRSNVKNYELLQVHAGRLGVSTSRDWIFVIALLLAMVTVVAALLVGVALIIRHFAPGH